jgi:hypothetical protein
VRTGLLTSTALGVLAVAACAGPTPGAGSGGTTTAATAAATSPSPTATGSSSPEPSATETETGAPFPTSVDTVTADPSKDAALTVTDVRTATHDGYDRVVFELGGTGAPGWRVGYVDKAVDDPSGQPVQVQGGGVLQVVISGTGYPTDTGQKEWTGNPLHPGLPVVQEVQLRGVFEGQTQAFVGVARTGAPFRVFALTAPARLVVDVQR